MCGYDSPTCDPGVKSIVQAAAKQAKPCTKTAPISKQEVEQCLLHLQKNACFKNDRLSVAIVLMFFGLLRVSEVVYLKKDHVTFFNGSVKILVASSKTDKQREGLSRQNLSENRDSISIIEEYYKSVKSAYFLPKCRGSEQMDAPVSADCLRTELRALFKELHFTKRLTPHSFRAGGASAAFNAGTPEAVVLKHGRWKSPAVFRNHYLTLSKQNIDFVSKQ